MATLKQRLHRKNASGTYDTVYFETSGDLITGVVAIANGGTGATTAANARTNLGITPANIGAAATSHTHTISQISSLQSEINSLKTSVSNGKAQIASAITDKGVSTSASASFSTMASNIRSIPTTGFKKFEWNLSNNIYHPPAFGFLPWFIIDMTTHSGENYKCQIIDFYTLRGYSKNVRITWIDTGTTSRQIAYATTIIEGQNVNYGSVTRNNFRDGLVSYPLSSSTFGNVSTFITYAI